jgi:hypothetical protein
MMSPRVKLMMFPHYQVLCLVIADDATNNFDASTLRTVSIEYHIILQITGIFSNHHKMVGK